MNGPAVTLGNASLMRDPGILLGDLEARADVLRGNGATALYVAFEGRIAGVVAIENPIKPTAPDAFAACEPWDCGSPR